MLEVSVKKGFTLAEVLVTIGVIGVVAALTIPTLSANYQKRVLTTQLQKAYAELSQAGAMALADEMGGDFHQLKTWKDGSFLEKFLKADDSASFADSYGMYNCSDCGENKFSEMLSGGNYHCGKLKSGASVCISERWNTVLLDVNSNKGPNLEGRDMFATGYGKDGTIGEYDHYLRSIVRADWDIDKAHD